MPQLHDRQARLIFLPEGCGQTELERGAKSSAANQLSYRPDQNTVRGNTLWALVSSPIQSVLRGQYQASGVWTLVKIDQGSGRAIQNTGANGANERPAKGRVAI